MLQHQHHARSASNHPNHKKKLPGTWQFPFRFLHKIPTNMKSCTYIVCRWYYRIYFVYTTYTLVYMHILFTHHVAFCISIHIFSIYNVCNFIFMFINIYIHIYIHGLYVSDIHDSAYSLNITLKNDPNKILGPSGK